MKKEQKIFYKKIQFFCRNFLWRDTGCFREKFALCEIENCVDFEDENKEVSDDAIDFEGKDFLLLLVEKQNENLVKTESESNARF